MMVTLKVAVLGCNIHVIWKDVLAVKVVGASAIKMLVPVQTASHYITEDRNLIKQ
jgi:hypothetical protein